MPLRSHLSVLVLARRPYLRADHFNGGGSLVAEDDPVVRMEVADILGDAGFDVLEASSAPAALAYLESHSGVALLFTDVLMPGRFDGLELAHEARRRWPEMPIVVVSGRLTASSAQLPERARFLSKPYCSHTVARVIREIGVCASLN